MELPRPAAGRRGEGHLDLQGGADAARGLAAFAKERGLWDGDPRASVIPSTFKTGYTPGRERPFARAELRELVPLLTPDAAAAVCVIWATSAEDVALHAAAS